MFVRHDTQKVLVVGLLVLAAVQQAVLAQETTANVPDEPQCRTWTDRSGKHRTEAVFIELKDGKVTLKKKDGTTIKVPLEILSDADREYVRTLGEQPPGEDRAKGQVPPTRGKHTGKQPPPQSKEVIVTGIGTNPDKAVQNAFSQTIEQVVGLLVESETVVKNDQLIHDEILTFSRGYVEKYEVIRRWQEDGLHHAKIRAVVARDKLVAKLRGIKIAVREVSGDLAARQFEFDAKNEEQAAEIFKKAIAGFDMTKLTKVEIVGKPEITRDGANAKMRIKVKVSPDQKRWKEFSRNLRTILAKTATKRAAVTCNASASWWWQFSVRSHDHESLNRQLHGEGILVSLLRVVNPNGEKSQWELFRVPDAMKGSIREAAKSSYRLRYALLDEQGNVLLQTYQPLMHDHEHVRPIREQMVKVSKGTTGYITAWWIGPVWLYQYRCMPWYESVNELVVSQEDLGKVVKTAVFLEEDKEAAGSW